MKNKIPTLFILLCFFISSKIMEAQCPELINFSTQSDIDNFINDYPNCTELNGGIFINGPDIENLNGFSNIRKIQGGLHISSTNNLTSLNGLNNLDSIGGDFLLIATEFIDLYELKNLRKIDGALLIESNNKLKNISGLSNLEFVGIVISIAFNNQLNDCNAHGFCEFITNTPVSVKIFENGTGCESFEQIVEECAQPCPRNFHFASQGQIDNFSIDHPNCFEVSDALRIQGDDITSIAVLSQIETIDEELIIKENPILTDLTGLENIRSINAFMEIKDNENLISLRGLDSLRNVNSFVNITNNHSLETLSGLEKLNMIEGTLYLTNNNSLTSLDALVKLNSIDNLSISSNDNLTDCSTEKICSYLESPENSAFIADNATACNTRAEVLDACSNPTVSIAHLEPKDLPFSVFPNPVSENLMITKNNAEIWEIRIIDNFGKQKRRQLLNQENKINVQSLAQGIYILQVKIGESIYNRRFVKL